MMVDLRIDDSCLDFDPTGFHDDGVHYDERLACYNRYVFGGACSLMDGFLLGRFIPAIRPLDPPQMDTKEKAKDFESSLDHEIRIVNSYYKKMPPSKVRTGLIQELVYLLQCNFENPCNAYDIIITTCQDNFQFFPFECTSFMLKLPGMGWDSLAERQGSFLYAHVFLRDENPAIRASISSILSISPRCIHALYPASCSVCGVLEMVVTSFFSLYVGRGLKGRKMSVTCEEVDRALAAVGSEKRSRQWMVMSL